MTIQRPPSPARLRDALSFVGVVLGGLALGAGAYSGYQALDPGMPASGRIHAPAIAATGPTSAALLAAIKSAGDDGLDTGRYRVAELERALERDPASAGSLMSRVLADYGRDLHVPGGERMVYIDQQLAPKVPPLGPDVSSQDIVRALRRMNPVYERLRTGLSWYRAQWASLPQVEVAQGATLTIGSSGPRVQRLRQRLGMTADGASADRFDETLARRVQAFRVVHGLGDGDSADPQTIAALNLGSAHYVNLIAANLDRARAIPAAPAPRYIVVDGAGAMLWLIEGGQVRDTMRVIVGKPGMETPTLAGLIRFAVFDPYWNIPPDLVRDKIAPRVLAHGTDYLARQRFETVTGWGKAARPIPSDSVDWPAVAQGRERVRVRQLPGGDNMMGRVKFMLPNRLGIYLHDTPNKGDFARSDRRISSGCVRVEDAERLARWLFGDQAAPRQAAADHRVDLPQPVPVYISYFTAVGEGGEVRFRPDPYRRDAALVARLQDRLPSAAIHR